MMLHYYLTCPFPFDSFGFLDSCFDMFLHPFAMLHYIIFVLCYILLLGGGSKYFLFSPLPGEMIQFDSYFFKWVETTN